MGMNNPFLPDLSVHRYEVKIKALTPFSIPYFPGSMLRGAFGVALKRTVCLNRKQACTDCLLRKTCVYRFLFETEIEISRITNPPHPLILYPLSLGSKKMRRGGVYHFGFTLFGHAVEYLPYVIYAIMQMGRLGMGKGKGKFELIEIKKFISLKRKRIIFTQKNGQLASFDTCLNTREILRKDCHKNTLILETITPLRFKIKGKLTDKISLKDILLSVTRRLKVLSQLYGSGKIDLLQNLDLDDMLKEVKTETRFQWVDFKRFSKRQNTHMRLGGVMGKMTITGNLSPLYPLLKLGEYIHIGKNTAFGLGRYRLC
ncbi:MAG: CRISPR system precrRNA processing endoribonuclease RAMP protein Cas6 [Candidatus Desulfofervidaceae bacterium]|nr:CRISPR system precrRNA processing endoribonuclease RAMP protein Cas6 [Candidatus Desulfofervidaceae bacterium]